MKSFLCLLWINVSCSQGGGSEFDILRERERKRPREKIDFDSLIISVVHSFRNKPVKGTPLLNYQLH